MNKIRKSRASKVIAGFVGFATAFTMSFGTAGAATTEELTAQIASLLATITSLQSQLSTMQGGTTGTTGGASYTFATNLKLGMTSPDVLNLQKVLNMNAATQVSATGAGSPGSESSYFGAKTKAAVIKFQELHAADILTPLGLTKGTGFVGTSMRAKLNTMGGTTGGTTGGTVGNTGPVSVMLSTDTPATGVIVIGQATADLAHFTFTGSGTVNSIMLKRSGISDQSTLSNVYLYDGNTRLTDGYSFNTNGDITINNLGLVINGMKVISVKADVNTTAGGASSGQTIAVWLTSFTSGVTATTVSLGGNTMSLASGSTLATASFTANTITGTPTVNAGVSSYVFWSAPLQVNTRTVSLKRVAFRMIGSAPADALSNIKLFVDGVDTGKVATVGMIQGANYATFDFDSVPMSLTTGSHTMDVRATIEKGSNRTVQFSIQQAADLMIMDPQVGVNVAVTGTIPNSAASIGINTGSLTVNIDPTFQAMTNITGGASNVPIAKYKLHAYGEDVKVTSLVVTPILTGATPGNTGLDDVTLYFNGSQVGTQQDWPAALGNLTFQLGSQLIAPVGVDSFLEVRSNIRTSTSTNYTAGNISANLQIGSTNGQGQSSLATFNVPGAIVTGNILTIQTGLLAVAKNSGYLSQNQNPNTAGVKIGSFTLQNQSSSESVRITNLLVALAVAGGSGLPNFSALKTSETSGSGAIPVQPQATNAFSVDFVLAPGATKTIDIFADTGSDSAGTIIPTLTVSSIGVTSNVSATSAAITGQTMTMSAGTVTNPPTFVASSATVAQLIAAANGGSPDGSKAVYNFLSTGAASTITELKFTVTTGTDTVTSVKVGSLSAPVVAGVAYLTGLNLAVPFGGSGLNQDVFVSYSTVGISGITSTTTSSIALTYVKYTSGGITTTFTPSVAAPTMVLVGSKPVFGVTDVSTTLINGLVRIADITVTADAKGDIKLGKLPISVTSTGVVTASSSANNIVVKDSNDAIVATTNTGLGVAAGGTGLDTIIFGTTVGNSYLIPAGQSKVFRIYTTAATVSGAVNTTSLSTKLGANTLVEWYDVAGNGTLPINAASVFNYPTDTSVISN